MRINIKFVKVVTLSALMGVGSVVLADDFAEGVYAAEQRDYLHAVNLWEPLAQQGHPDAQFNLGLLYHSGTNGNVYEKKAVEWYHKAAENGHLQAQEYLAVGYQEGWFGLTKSKKKATYWANKIEEK